MMDINVYDYEHLEAVMIDNLSTNDQVTLVSDFETVWEVAMDFHSDGIEFDLELVEINTDNYDREYYLTLVKYDNEIYMYIEKAFSEKTGQYYATDGVVFVEDIVNSKYLKDMKANKDYNSTIIVFSFDDDENYDGCCDCAISKEVIDNRVTFTIPICMEELVKAIDNLIVKQFR